MGRERSDSPFNAVAVLSFVGFFLTLSARFEFNVIHAYVIPIGVGILILLHLFGQEMHPDAKNRIRIVTLLAMLGSTGWYAIIGGAYPLTFNLRKYTPLAWPEASQTIV